MLRELTQNKFQGDFKMCDYENTNYRNDSGCGCGGRDRDRDRDHGCGICNFCGFSEDTLILIAIIILFILLFCCGDRNY